MIGQLGGIALVIKALRKHKQSSEMQRWGYKALRSLATANDLAALKAGKQAASSSTRGVLTVSHSEVKQPLIQK